MVKKIIAGVLVCIMLGTSSITVSYANNAINKSQYETKNEETNKYFFEVLEPEKNTVSTDKNILLSFRASEGTNVCIEVYHNISANNKKENYVLSYDPIEITVGAFQKGWASVDLKSGLNKILFKIKYKNKSTDTFERTVNVMDVREVKRLMQDVVNKSTLGIRKR